MGAAARVKWYDGDIMGDVNSAIRSVLREKSLHNPEHVASVVCGLADINAYDRDLFDLAAKALTRFGGGVAQQVMEAPVRKKILTAYSKVRHNTDLPILDILRQQEGSARYEAAKQEVEAEWQKLGKTSGRAM